MGLTIAEKIFARHLLDTPDPEHRVLKLDRVFCHEITTPLAINDLAARGWDRVFDREKIKAVIDHVSPAKDGKTALQGKILRDWAGRQGIDFFDIGRNGVCHALFPEKGFVRPGQTIIMGDSHTCTYGAFGAFAAGVGTTDLEVGILKGVCAFRSPRTFKIEVTGKLAPGVFAKDLILRIISLVGTGGATDMIIEFTGEGIRRLTMEERMTLCNMAVEAGATSGIVAPDEETVGYLWPFIRDDWESPAQALEAYRGLHSDPDAVWEKTLAVDAGALEPLVTVGYKPDQVKAVRKLEKTPVDQVYIGSCTNGRIGDLRAAAEVLKPEVGRGRKIAPRLRAIVSPATTLVFHQALKEGLLDIFMEAGFCVTNPTCGACLGMSNGILAEGEVCASTTNRNFQGRMGKGGMIHLMSPATAAATALEGFIVNSRLYRGREIEK